jgi:histidine ammonia-lyase
MNNVYYVGSGELTFSIIERIINENLKLELAPEAEQRIRKCRDYLDRKIAASTEPLYGITTGFGSLCSKNISSDEIISLPESLELSMPSSTQIRLTPKSCISCKEFNTSAAFLPNLPPDTCLRAAKKSPWTQMP